MQKITPHLWFDKEAREAAEFYVSIFPQSKIKSITTLHDTPSGSVDPVTFELLGPGVPGDQRRSAFQVQSVDIISRHLQERRTKSTRFWGKTFRRGYGAHGAGGIPFQRKISDGCRISTGFPGRFHLRRSGRKTEDHSGASCSWAAYAAKQKRRSSSGHRCFMMRKSMRSCSHGKGEEPDKEGTVKYAAFSLLGQEFGSHGQCS